MAKIPLPDGLEGSEDLPQTRTLLRNCWKNKKGYIIQRPGIIELQDLGAKNARGAFTFNGALYMVFLNDLVKITNPATGEPTVIGTISGSNIIEVAISFTHAMIVVKGEFIYTLDKSDVLEDISNNPNFVPAVDVVFLKQRFDFIPADGSPVFFTDAGAPFVIQGLSFFDAEDSPDNNKAALVKNNILYILGAQSIQSFYDKGGNPIPYVTREATIDTGYIGGLVETNDTWLFIGREKDQDFGIYALGQGVAPKISNEPVDLILSTFTQGELAEARGQRFKWRGDFVTVFSFRRGPSLGFLNGNWFLFDTLIDADDTKLGPWGGGFITEFQGEYFTAFEGKIGKLAKVNTDYGKDMVRTIEFTLKQPDLESFTLQELQLGITQGFTKGTLSSSQGPVDNPFEGTSPSTIDIPTLASLPEFVFLSTQEDKSFIVGEIVKITLDADPNVFMTGEVVSYSGGFLNVSVTAIGGSGAFEDWTINVVGAPEPVDESATVETGSVGLSLSQDNELFDQPFFRNLGKLGEYKAQLQWNFPGGLGRYDNGFVGIRLQLRADHSFSCSYLVVDASGELTL